MPNELERRTWTSNSIAYLANRLSLKMDLGMQDWAFEVADAARLDDFLAVFRELAGDEDVRYTLADVIIQSFEELEDSLESDPRWQDFVAELGKNLRTHAGQVNYWACSHLSEVDAWRVSPAMRAILEAGEFGT